MIKFIITNPEGWTQEQFEKFFSEHFRYETATIYDFEDTWDGNNEFDVNIWQTEENGPIGCSVYKCIMENGFMTTDTQL